MSNKGGVMDKGLEFVMKEMNKVFKEASKREEEKRIVDKVKKIDKLGKEVSHDTMYKEED